MQERLRMAGTIVVPCCSNMTQPTACTPLLSSFKSRFGLPCCAADDGHSSHGQTVICGYGGVKVTQCQTNFAVSDAITIRLQQGCQQPTVVPVSESEHQALMLRTCIHIEYTQI